MRWSTTKVRLSRSVALPEAFQILQTNWAEECDLGHRSQMLAAGWRDGCPEGLVAKLIAQHGADMRLPISKKSSLVIARASVRPQSSIAARCTIHSLLSLSPA
jgi:hypothetical protein